MIGLDFETASPVDIRERGGDNYVRHPQTRVIVAATYDGSKMWSWNILHGGEKPLSIMSMDLRFRLNKHPRVAAHNAAFEQGILAHVLGVDVHSSFVDTAINARAYGAGERLEAAGPQLVGADKMEEGERLIKKFSIPRKDGTFLIDDLDSWSNEDYTDWSTFVSYCEQDARLSYWLAAHYPVASIEQRYYAITQKMNDNGWYVNQDLMARMQRRRQENLSKLEERFRLKHDIHGKLNFRSTPQLRKWCRDRGVMAQSFDEVNVRKLRKRLERMITTMENTQGLSSNKQILLDNYRAVDEMLKVKQELGGSSLSKLDAISRLLGEDGRLRGQYVHVGAGQTYRTSGRGAQLQNLKKLGKDGPDDPLLVPDWTNEQLARNMRQLFKAEHPDGRLIVSDFSSMESRVLAALAGADWKLKAFLEGKDMYMVMAASMFSIQYESVTPDQRKSGKVGELGCGFGAGPKAIVTFAEKMNIDIDLDAATEIVSAWRDSNPEIVALWKALEDGLRTAVMRKRSHTVTIGGRYTVSFIPETAPASLLKQRPDALQIRMSLYLNGAKVLNRMFQGVYLVGDDIAYHKPSKLKSGKLWLDRWHKDGVSGRYTLYGGKLAGILTQSFARELFFQALDKLDYQVSKYSNVKLIGQFHDEVILEWQPVAFDESKDTTAPVQVFLPRLMREVHDTMREAGVNYDIPVDATIAHDRRYIK